MKHLFIVLALLLELFLLHSAALSQISPQRQIRDCDRDIKQLTLDQIKERIRINVSVTNEENKAALDKGIATEIAGTGIRGFQLNDSILNDLRKLGAGRQTIQALIDEDARNRRKAEPQVGLGTSNEISRLAVGSFTVNGDDKWSWAGQSTSSFLTIQLQKVAKTISVIDYQLFAPPVRSVGTEYLNGYLSIDHIVSGNLELMDNRHRLNLFVTRVSDRSIKYSEAFITSKNGLDAIVDLQQQATLEIMRVLKGSFTLTDNLERTKLLPTSSLLAYEHYAKAVELTNQYEKSLLRGDPEPDSMVTMLQVIHNPSFIEFRGRAIKEYEKSIELDPSFTWPLHNLAILYSSIHERARAIQLLRQVLKLDADFHEARLRLAYLLFEEGTFLKYHSVIDPEVDQAKGASLLNESLKEIELVIAQRPDQVDALMLEGKLYDDLGRSNDAILILEKAVNKNPCYSNARTQLAGLYIDAGKTAEAKRQLEKAIEIDQNNARANFMLGELLHKEKNYSEAIKRYEKSVANGFQEYEVDRSRLRYTIGRAYLDIEDLRKAIMHYQHLFTLNPRLSAQAVRDLREFAKKNPQKIKDADENTREALISLGVIAATPNK